jgi:uncharacterized membrane protein YagU involved in acid resistance
MKQFIRIFIDIILGLVISPNLAFYCVHNNYINWCILLVLISLFFIIRVLYLTSKLPR